MLDRICGWGKSDKLQRRTCPARRIPRPAAAKSPARNGLAFRPVDEPRSNDVLARLFFLEHRTDRLILVNSFDRLGQQGRDRDDLDPVPQILLIQGNAIAY